MQQDEEDQLELTLNCKELISFDSLFLSSFATSSLIKVTLVNLKITALSTLVFPPSLRYLRLISHSPRTVLREYPIFPTHLETLFLGQWHLAKKKGEMELQLPPNLIHLALDTMVVDYALTLPVSLNSFFTVNSFFSEKCRLFPDLRELRMTSCGVKELRGLPLLPAGLKSLNLSMNRLHADFPVDWFPSGLEVLDLHGNALSNLSSLVLPPSLLVLDLSMNAQRRQTDHFTLHFPLSVTDLNLSRMMIRTISHLVFPPRLVRLNLSNNFIGNISLLKVTLPLSLEYLNLSHNRITDFSTVNLSLHDHLTVLSLHHNGSTSSHIRLPPNLMELDVSYNLIMDVCELDLPDLTQHVNLEGNVIRTVQDLRLPPNLNTLNLSHNQITNISVLRIPYSLTKLDIDQTSHMQGWSDFILYRLPFSRLEEISVSSQHRADVKAALKRKKVFQILLLVRSCCGGGQGSALTRLPLELCKLLKTFLDFGHRVNGAT